MTGAIASLDLKAGAGAPCPLVSFRCAWYSAYRARRSWPTLAVVVFEGEVPIPRVSAPRSSITRFPVPWARSGGAVGPSTTAASAR
jgi:hypothetical protein